MKPWCDSCHGYWSWLWLSSTGHLCKGFTLISKQNQHKIPERLKETIKCSTQLHKTKLMIQFSVQAQMFNVGT